MKPQNHSSTYWLVPGAAFAGAAAFVWSAFRLLHHVLVGHGGRAGNILRIGLSLGAFVAGVFCLAVGTLYRLSFQQDNGERFR